jgi:hypothetical protein
MDRVATPATNSISLARVLFHDSRICAAHRALVPLNRRALTFKPSMPNGYVRSSGLELLHQGLNVHVVPAFDDLAAFDDGEG